MSSPASPGIYRFGIYEVDLFSGELRKAGVRLRLPEQAFRALVAMLERPSQAITREELRARLWPEGTFVDFDHGLNTIINKLRETLNDNASNPRFIETLARRGYRFIAPVEFVTSGINMTGSGDSPSVRGGGVNTAQPGSLLTAENDVPSANPRLVDALFLLLQVMYLAFYIAALARMGRIQNLLDQYSHPQLIVTLLVTSAVIGIPLRLYLLCSTMFGITGLAAKFGKLFAGILVLDTLWATAPFLLVPQIGIGLALAATAVLLYAPFAQRTLLLIQNRSTTAI